MFCNNEYIETLPKIWITTVTFDIPITRSLYIHNRIDIRGAIVKFIIAQLLFREQ